MTAIRRQRLCPDVYAAPGSAALLTVCCKKRRQVFDRPKACEIVIAHLNKLHGGSWAILGYVIMPDHVHTVVVNRSASLIEFVRFLKGRSSADFRNLLGLCDVWQQSFHDRMLRRTDDLGAVIQYIFENPVRAGLVHSWIDFPWVGSCMWPEIGTSLEATNINDIQWNDALVVSDPGRG